MALKRHRSTGKSKRERRNALTIRGAKKIKASLNSTGTALTGQSKKSLTSIFSAGAGYFGGMYVFPFLLALNAMNQETVKQTKLLTETTERLAEIQMSDKWESNPELSQEIREKTGRIAENLGGNMREKASFSRLKSFASAAACFGIATLSTLGAVGLAVGIGAVQVGLGNFALAGYGLISAAGCIASAAKDISKGSFQSAFNNLCCAALITVASIGMALLGPIPGAVAATIGAGAAGKEAITKGNQTFNEFEAAVKDYDTKVDEILDTKTLYMKTQGTVQLSSADLTNLKDMVQNKDTSVITKTKTAGLKEDITVTIKGTLDVSKEAKALANASQKNEQPNNHSPVMKQG